jgi:exonuclease SbcD
MKFIHTADWHLGRLFHGVHLTEDQAQILDQVLDLVRDTSPDAFIIAGDVYDRAVPPPEAVKLLDDVLSRLVLGLGVPTIIIAGNHDSAQRLGFGSRLLAEQRLNVVTSVGHEAVRVTLQDDHGPVHFFPVPYCEPAVVRWELDDDSIRDHQTAMERVTARARHASPQAERSVLIAHGFVAGGQQSDSERPLSVGGAEQVDAGVLTGFNYVALGHLHRPQTAGGDHIRYSGSLLKYSFSEADHVKGVNLVEMDAQGECRVEQIVLEPVRDVRRIEGYLTEILSNPEEGERAGDYLAVSLLDKGAILDVMAKLRTVYPNVLHVERPHLTLRADRRGDSVDRRTRGDWELFADFFREVTGDPPSAAHRSAYESIVEALRRSEAEGST